jgi:hypothetical protein
MRINSSLKIFLKSVGIGFFAPPFLGYLLFYIFVTSQGFFAGKGMAFGYPRQILSGLLVAYWFTSVPSLLYSLLMSIYGWWYFNRVHMTRPFY